jgi:4-coumarate--CoA ligase
MPSTKNGGPVIPSILIVRPNHDNCVDTPAITYGVAWTGGVTLPANPTYTAEELAFQLSDSKANALVTQTPLLPIARVAARKAGISEDWIMLIGDRRDPEGRFKHFTSILNVGKSGYCKTKIDPRKDVVFLVYSSGTTGLSKGVMLSHRNIIADVLQIRVVEPNFDVERGQGWER